MAEFLTLTTVDEVRNAGNIDIKIPEPIITFYLNFSSIMLKEIIGDENYAKALANQLEGFDNDKLRMAEALMAVGVALPALANPTVIAGTTRTTRVGVGGETEVFSFTKEITSMASYFLQLGKNLVPSALVQDTETFGAIWSSTIMRVFPGIDEIPTVATIASDVEELLKDDRGDSDYGV